MNERDIELIDQSSTENDLVRYFNMSKLIELIRADEREECAKVCEEIMEEHNPFDRQANIARSCASGIRARGNE